MPHLINYIQTYTNMKFIIAILFLTLITSCSGKTEKQKNPLNKSKPIKSKPLTQLQSDITQEHMSGSGGSHISGVPSSSHISGQ